MGGRRADIFSGVHVIDGMTSAGRVADRGFSTYFKMSEMVTARTSLGNHHNLGPLRSVCQEHPPIGFACSRFRSGSCNMLNNNEINAGKIVRAQQQIGDLDFEHDQGCAPRGQSYVYSKRQYFQLR